MKKMQIGIIILTLATAIIHLLVFGRFGGSPFLLNGLGYLGLLGALYLPLTFLLPYRKSAHWVLMGYTALTIILYFVFQGGRAFSNSLGLADKAIEIVLVVLLWLEVRRL